MNFKSGDATEGIGADNFEFEYTSAIGPYPWQTDKTMTPSGTGSAIAPSNIARALRSSTR